MESQELIETVLIDKIWHRCIDAMKSCLMPTGEGFEGFYQEEKYIPMNYLKTIVEGTAKEYGLDYKLYF